MRSGSTSKPPTKDATPTRQLLRAERNCEIRSIRSAVPAGSAPATTSTVLVVERFADQTTTMKSRQLVSCCLDAAKPK